MLWLILSTVFPCCQVLQVSQNWTSEERHRVATQLMQQTGSLTTQPGTARETAESEDQAVYSPRKTMPVHTWSKKGSHSARPAVDSEGFAFNASVVDPPTYRSTSEACGHAVVNALLVHCHSLMPCCGICVHIRHTQCTNACAASVQEIDM